MLLVKFIPASGVFSKIVAPEKFLFGHSPFVLLSQADLALEDWRRLALGWLPWRGNGNLVSFPVATFNRIEILVNRTIPSILAQTQGNVEVAFVAGH